jgi:O-antigen ligase
MTINKSIRNVFDIILPLLAVGIYFGYSTSIFCFILLFVRILFIGNIEKAIFFILFGTSYLGLVFTTLNIPLPGSILSLLIGFIIIHKKIFILIRRHKKSFRYLSLFILIFFISYLYGPKTEYSNMKMITIIYFGYISLIALLVYSTSTSISNRDLAQVLMLVGISYIVIGIDFYSFSKPTNLFDFSYFRSSSISLRNQDLFYINYHLPAITILYGFSFWFSSVDLRKKEIFYLILFSITTLYVILISGTRQALFGFFILILFRLLYLSKKKRILNYFITIAIFGLSFLFVSNNNTDSLNNVVESETIEVALNRDYIRTFDMIDNNLFFGVGLGGFYDESVNKDKYPHNIILEILCEGGLIALILCLFLIWHYFRNEKLIKYKTQNNSFLYLIFLAFLLRAFVSEDLGSNIIIFSIFLAAVTVNHKKI